LLGRVLECNPVLTLKLPELSEIYIGREPQN
jgi:hypothetical protein